MARRTEWVDLARPLLAHPASGGHEPESRATSNLNPIPTQRTHHAPTVVDYVNIRWVDDWCKRCNICVEICPKDSLVLTHNAIIEVEDCIRCGLCERYCPDLAIEVLAEPRAVGGVPAEMPAGAGAGRFRTATPDVARGPAVAGTDPARGISDVESQSDTDRANPT